MVIHQFNFVNLSLPELVAQLTGQVDALLDVGLVGQVSEVAANGIPKFGSFLGNLAPYGINHDILLAQRLIVGRHRLHQLDDI